MVSRVSPPAKSTGLLRLQRGGSIPSTAASRSSGSGVRSRYLWVVTASAVTTPHPPAVLSTTTPPPSGRGWVANVAAASNAASMVAARTRPACRAMPSNTREQALRHWADLALARGQSNLLDEAVPAFERIMIETALKHTAGRRRDAALLLGWGRNTLTRKIKELGMGGDSADEDEGDEA